MKKFIIGLTKFERILCYLTILFLIFVLIYSILIIYFFKLTNVYLGNTLLSIIYVIFISKYFIDAEAANDLKSIEISYSNIVINAKNEIIKIPQADIKQFIYYVDPIKQNIIIKIITDNNEKLFSTPLIYGVVLSQISSYINNFKRLQNNKLIDVPPEIGHYNIFKMILIVGLIIISMLSLVNIPHIEYQNLFFTHNIENIYDINKCLVNHGYKTIIKNDNDTYLLQVQNTSNKGAISAVIMLADEGKLQNLRLNNKYISYKKIIRRYIKGVNKFDYKITKDNNIARVNIEITYEPNANIAEIKEKINKILLSSIDNLQESNIIYRENF